MLLHNLFDESKLVDGESTECFAGEELQIPVLSLFPHVSWLKHS